MLADLHHDGKQLLHAPILTNCEQSLTEERIDLVTLIAQHICVIGIGCHTSDSEQDQ